MKLVQVKFEKEFAMTVRSCCWDHGIRALMSPEGCLITLVARLESNTTS